MTLKKFIKNLTNPEEYAPEAIALAYLLECSPAEAKKIPIEAAPCSEEKFYNLTIEADRILSEISL